MKSEFIHLHNHSDNSLLDGAQTINTIINTMDDLGMDSVALTEHGNLFGAISFYSQAKNQLLVVKYMLQKGVVLIKKKVQSEAIIIT